MIDSDDEFLSNPISYDLKSQMKRTTISEVSVPKRARRGNNRHLIDQWTDDRYVKAKAYRDILKGRTPYSKS